MIHQENCKFAFSAFPSRKSGKKWKKQGNYGIVKQDPRRSSAKSMKSSASFPDVSSFCSDLLSSLCCVVKSSFDLPLFAGKTRIQTSVASSEFVQYPSSALGLLSNSFGRSNGCSRNGCTSNRKAMLLNKVVVGKGYKMTASTAMTVLPAGYDSASVIQCSMILRRGTDEDTGLERSRRSIELRRTRG